MFWLITIGLLGLLTVLLPFFYTRYFNSVTSVHTSNPHPEAKEKIAIQFNDIGLRKKLLLEHLSRVCWNATNEKLPYQIKEIYGGGPFFDPLIKAGELASKVVVVCVVEKESTNSKDGKKGPVPKVTPTYRFLESFLAPQFAGDVTSRFSDPIAALPEMLKTAAQDSKAEIKDLNKTLPVYIKWLEGLSWKLILDHRDTTPEGDRNPKPWEAERILKRVLRWGTKGVDIGPAVLEHPSKYRDDLFNESVHFHLLWNKENPDVLGNARLAFNSYLEKKSK